MTGWRRKKHAKFLLTRSEIALGYRDMTSFTTQLRLFDLSSFYEKYLQQRVSLKQIT